jgi:hypothetical protein
MPDFGTVPTFTAGEPGFSVKLNELGDVLKAVIAHLETSCPATAALASATPKVTPRKTATAK